MPPKKRGKRGAGLAAYNQERAEKPAPPAVRNASDQDSDWEPETSKGSDADAPEALNDGVDDEEVELTLLDEERAGGTSERRSQEVLSKPGLAARRANGAARMRRPLRPIARRLLM